MYFGSLCVCLCVCVEMFSCCQPSPWQSPWRLKSQANRQIVQQPIQANNEGKHQNSTLLAFLWIIHRWIPVRKHQSCGKCVYVMNVSWASCQIRKIAGAHAPGMPGTFSPSPRVNDPDMHHGTCVTHVPWCMPGSLTSGFLWNRRRRETFPALPAHAQPAILRIW